MTPPLPSRNSRINRYFRYEIAGFADNQAYGFGTNTWTESQKSTAIYGGLGLFFLLFIGGYALN